MRGWQRSQGIRAVNAHLISDLIDAALLTVRFLPVRYTARYRIQPDDGKAPDLRQRETS